MKLFHSWASPFVRKVMVLVHETGLDRQIECIPAVVSPVARNAAVVAHNPAGHIPTLLLDDGTALYDSVVICQYLDTLHGGPLLHPEPVLARSQTLCLQALADSIMDAGVLIRFETGLRPAELRWPAWLDGQHTKVASGVSDLAGTWRSHLDGPLDMGVIAAGCALGYIDFRLPNFNWKLNNPELSAWYERFAQRPSMQATWPQAMVVPPSPNH